MSADLITENLISLIFDRAPIWNSQDHNHKNRKLVNRLWLDIKKELNIEDLYDDETTRRIFPTSIDLEFEPVTTKDKKKMVLQKNINCDDFHSYDLNCTVDAAILYNANSKSPPMPAKIADWCQAIRHFTNCAIDWNFDCRDVTESHYNEESIKGHVHVLENVCDNEVFLSRYKGLSRCIAAKSDAWESCYLQFKKAVDEQKNKTLDWTHFDTHFYLCCARARFRRCTLDSVFDSRCTNEQSKTLQKFSVIVSEGDVYQDCDTNIMYSECPGGDPRPSNAHLAKLMSSNAAITFPVYSYYSHLLVSFYALF